MFMSHYKISMKSWRRLLLLLLAIVVQQGITFAQTGTVSGTVKDDKGSPIPSATVQVANSQRMVLTDEKGSFTIGADAERVSLVISSAGYITANFSARTGQSVDIILKKQLKDLDEVVVVAYGQQKKTNVVGSVSQISGEQLKQAPTMNVTNMLAGRLPGLISLQQSGRPGADDATLRIRGISSYGSNQSPLIIVDGVQRPSFSNLDPSEIESVTMLKDAVSTAVYGLQAANGIILVTTKRGKAQKTVISYDGAVTMNQNTRFPKFLDGPDYMQWYNKGTDMDNDYNMQVGANPAPYIYTQEQIDALRNGTNTNPLLGNTDWVGELVGKNSFSQSHSISLRGGTDKIKFFSQVGMLDQDGVVNNTGFKRYNVRTNVDAELTKVFSVALDLGIRQTNTKTPGISPDNTAYLNPFYQAVRMLPNLPMYAPNGLPTAHFSNAGWVNPLASVDQSGYQNDQSNVFQGNLTFKVKVPWIKGLEAKLMTAYDKTGNEAKSWLTPYTLMGRNRDQVTGDYVELNTLPGITRTTLRQSYSQNNRKTFQPSITYNNSFGDHSIQALALYEWSQYKNNVFSTGASNFPLTDLHEIDFGSPATEDMIAPTGSSGLDSRAGYVGRINYGFKEKYLLELATRVDASINFPTDNRWKLFPAVGAGWVVSRENFFDGLSRTVDFLKIKGSWGQTGNDRIGTFRYLQTFALTDDPVMVIGGKPVQALYTSAPPNTNLNWETATTTNIGFESVFLKGLLAVDFEWFYKVTTDILSPVGGLYPMTIGGYYPSTVNYGIMDNRGFDLQIRHRNRIGKLQYGVTGNLNWAKNKIIRRDESEGLPEWMRTVGRSYGEKFGFVAEGMYQNWEEAATAPSPSGGVVAPGFFRYKDINGDGRITRTDDFVSIGRSNIPELMYGLNIDLSYGNFDFSVFFQGAALSSVSLAGTYEGSSGTSGVDDNTPFTKTFYGYGNSPYFLVENAWTPDNPGAEFPRLTAYKSQLSAHNAHINSGWIRDGSYMRLKAMQLGYNVPSKLLNTVKIQNLRVYVSGYNLFTWDKLKYLDPEMPNVNNGFYPQQRMMSGGVNVTF